MKAFQDDIDRFEERGVQVLGASRDSLETHQRFAAELGLTFPLLADDGTLGKRYGTGRITYLVDRGGTIRFIQRGMPDNDVLIEAIDRL